METNKADCRQKNRSEGTAVYGNCLKDFSEYNLAGIWVSVRQQGGTHEAEMWVGH